MRRALGMLLDWRVSVPAVAILVLAATRSAKPGSLVLALVGVLLAASVLAAVHHAEVVAHRVGEPYGALILAVAEPTTLRSPATPVRPSALAPDHGLHRRVLGRRRRIWRRRARVGRAIAVACRCAQEVREFGPGSRP